MYKHPAVGAFDHQSVVSTYQPTLANLHDRCRAQLPIQVYYLYGGWREDDGTLHVFERKFIGPMTAGLWLMRVEGDTGVQINPNSIRTVRGEAKRTFDEDRVVWHGQMMEAQAGDDSGMELAFTDGNLDWVEGEILQLHGDLVGPGLQMYAQDPDTPFYYGSELYKVGGTVLGADVEGFVFFDCTAWPHGTDWKEYEVFNHLQLGWEAFANEFEDGTIEWGHLCIGAERFSFAMTAGATEATALASVGVHGGVDLGEDEWAERATWVAGDDQWVFEMEDSGRLTEFTEARWGGYRAQCGYTRRINESRQLKLGFSWLETFAHRLAENKIPSAADLLD